MRFIGRIQSKFVIGISCWCCVLSLVTQAGAGTLTITANFSAGFTQAEESVIDASISIWESLLSVPENRTVSLIFEKAAIPGAFADAGNFTMDVLGNPTGADIRIDSGTNFFVDPTPFDNSEYTPSGIPFLLDAKTTGPAFNQEDLLSIVTHEIGHALGWAGNTQGPGFDRFDSRLDFGVSTINYVGENFAVAMADDSHPQDDFDLMGVPGFQVSERALVSNLDRLVLNDAFDYDNTKILRHNGPTVALADAITDNVPVKTQITLGVSEHATIQDLDLALFIEHTFDQDLDIELVSPLGTRILLASAVGADTDNFGTTELWTRFDDEAFNPLFNIVNNIGPFEGTFLPEGFLSAFDGEDIFGTWILEISDFFPGDTGTLNDFALIVGVPEPSTLALLMAAGGFILRRPKRITA